MAHLACYVQGESVHAMARLSLRLFMQAALLILTAACSLMSAAVNDSARATPSPNAVSETTTPEQMPLVYYYFAAIASNTFPAGSVVILPDVLILSPTVSTIARSADAAANIQSALEAMIRDARNAWTSSDLAVTSVTINGDHATVILSGEISGVGDVVLMAARMQFLMTVFAEPSVQTATVTVNGESIGNLGISHSSEAKPADYAYTRAEIERFMAENALNR